MSNILFREMFEAIFENEPTSYKNACDKFEELLEMNIESISDNKSSCRGEVHFVCNEELSTNSADRPKLIIASKEDKEIPTLCVDDPGTAWLKVCSYILHKDKAKSVAITGSVGKTTVKDIIYSVLAKAGNSIRSHGSINGTRGFCVAISNERRKINYFSCEMGLNHPQNHFPILSAALQPDICVITNIGSCHIDNFCSKEHILESKMRCADFMSRETGLLLINADDELLMKTSYQHPIKTYAIRSKNADYHCTNVKIMNDAVEFTAVCPDRMLDVRLNVPGEHNIYGALAAIAVADKFAISDEIIKDGLAEFRTEGIRQNVSVIHDNITVINDCYGASPEANVVAFNMLASMQGDGERQRRIAVLGHISRMGRLSESIHRELGKKLAEYKFDMVVTYGGKSSVFTEEVQAAGGVAYHFYDDVEFVKFMKDNLQANDIVLFKGVHKSYGFDKYVNQIIDKKLEPNVTPYYGICKDETVLHVTSPSMVLMNSATGKVFSGKNMHEKRNVASLFSLVSVIAALEKMDVEEVVTICDEVTSYTKGCKKYGLKPGEQYKVKDLLWLVLLRGSSDAIYSIALHYSKHISEFVSLQNEVLRKVGAANTNCTEPYGKPNKNCYSTAYDMALIAAYALENETFVKIIENKSCNIKEYTTGISKEIIYTTKINTLDVNDDHCLFSPYINILKEGMNALSGKCIVAARKCNRHDKGYQVAVVLGTTENAFTLMAYNEIKCLLDYQVV